MATLPNPPRRHRLIAGLAVASLILAACGDDDDDDAGGDTAPAAATEPAGTEPAGTEPAGTDPFAGADTEPDGTTGATGGGGGGEGLTVLFGSSGQAETDALEASAARFTEATGTPVEVVAAQDLAQQMTQGFAGGSPADVFYASPEQTRQWQDSMFAYGDQIEDVDDFYPSLTEAYTIDDTLYCLPKDFSNLALVINTAVWEAAGLTDEDIPTTWDELTEVSTTLTTGDQTGLVFSGDADRVGAFMVQAGGWFTNEDQTEATATTPENEEALTYLQENLEAGNFKFAADVDAGWGGEAFGTGKGAMTIEGPWLVGAINADWPDVQWQGAELPEGPAGMGTLTFSNCWGIAADGDTEGSLALVEHFTSPDEQMAFTEAFGVSPSRVSLEEWNAEAQPEKEAFNAGVAYAQAPVSLSGFASVKTDFNAQLEALKEGTTTPADVLERLQQTTEEVLADQ